MPHLTVFIVPSTLVKNGEDRLVVCNDVARSVIEGERGKNPTHVFSFRGYPLTRMLSTGWRVARQKAGLDQVRVHDLKHTFGRRLRAAGVSFEDRQDLLGHRSSRVTTHYSSAELQNLYEAANKVCEQKRNGVTLMVLSNPNYKGVSEHKSEAVNASATGKLFSLMPTKCPQGNFQGLGETL